MLVLSRKVGEKVVVPECGLTLTVLSVQGQRVRLGIAAPAETVAQRAEVWVQDMNSSNGTYVNDRLALLPQALQDGDELRVATLTFRVALRPEAGDSSVRLRHDEREVAAAS